MCYIQVAKLAFGRILEAEMVAVSSSALDSVKQNAIWISQFLKGEHGSQKI